MPVYLCQEVGMGHNFVIVEATQGQIREEKDFVRIVFQSWGNVAINLLIQY